MSENEKLVLDNVTLIAVSSVKIRKTIKALEYSMRGVQFAEAVLVTHKKPLSLPENITYKHTEKITNIDMFNYMMVYDLYKYVDTDYALLIHYDGFVVNPDKWQDRFLDYDYIGSPRPIPPEDDKITYRDIHGNLCRVGNSVSIRSKRLMELPSKLNIPWQPFHGWFNEDGFICCNNRHIFEEHGMKFAPVDVAIHFGQESMVPEGEGVKSFAFHKWAGTNAQYPKF